MERAAARDDRRLRLPVALDPRLHLLRRRPDPGLGLLQSDRLRRRPAAPLGRDAELRRRLHQRRPLPALAAADLHLRDRLGPAGALRLAAARDPAQPAAARDPLLPDLLLPAEPDAGGRDRDPLDL